MKSVTCLILSIVFTACSAERSVPKTDRPEAPTTKSLAGWTVTGNPEAFALEEPGILATLSKGGSFLVSKARYTDFELSCRFRLDAAARSAIVLRAEQSNPEAGLIIPIVDSCYAQPTPTVNSCGGLADKVAPSSDPLRPSGEWNELGIRCAGQDLRVTINDRVVMEHRLEPGSPTSGAIAIRDNGHFAWFQDLIITDLGPK